jgi:glutamine synthetase
MTLCPTGATLSEAEAFLAAHPEIEAIDLILTDSNGIARGKIIRRHELAAATHLRGAHVVLAGDGLEILEEEVPRRIPHHVDVLGVEEVE